MEKTDKKRKDMKKDGLAKERIDKNPNVIKNMFDGISARYDFLNGLLSGYQDRRWRRIAAKKCGLNRDSAAIDVACGTGNLTFELAKYSSGKIVGIDFSSKMIAVANKKLDKRKSESDKLPGLGNVSFEIGDAEKIRFNDNTFDCATIGFGIRNVSNVNKAILEMKRVIKKKGKIAILELSVPKNSLLKKAYLLYFLKIIPILGGAISGSKNAYKYLPRSVINFYTADEMKQIMERAGFIDVQIHHLTFGIAFLCIGTKK